MKQTRQFMKRSAALLLALALCLSLSVSALAAEQQEEKSLEETAREAAAAAGRQAEEAVSRLRLEREIRDLQEEIRLQMQAVGEKIYAAHRGSPSDSGQVQEILEYVDGLREEALSACRDALGLTPPLEGL